MYFLGRSFINKDDTYASLNVLPATEFRTFYVYVPSTIPSVQAIIWLFDNNTQPPLLESYQIKRASGMGGMPPEELATWLAMNFGVFTLQELIDPETISAMLVDVYGGLK